jgi:hypothetical protein
LIINTLEPHFWGSFFPSFILLHTHSLEFLAFSQIAIHLLFESWVGIQIELPVIVESKFDPVHVSAGTGDDFELETSIEVYGGILADLHSVQVLPPEFYSDLCPGFGYFTFGKFGLRALHGAKKSTIPGMVKDTKKPVIDWQVVYLFACSLQSMMVSMLPPAKCCPISKNKG